MHSKVSHVISTRVRINPMILAPRLALTLARVFVGGTLYQKAARALTFVYKFDRVTAQRPVLAPASAGYFSWKQL